MKFEWDIDKSNRNLLERGIGFEVVEDFEWSTAVILEDTRHDYGERRLRAMGMILGKLYVVVFTPRLGAVRVISLRRANKREESCYEKNKET